MRRKIYLCLAILIASVAQMRAQQMAVALNDGGELRFEENYTSCQITFSDGQLLLHVDGAVKSTIGIKDIDNIYFYAIDTSVNELKSRDGVEYSAATETLIVYAQPGTVIAVYNASGALALAHVQTIAAAPLSVAHLSEGVYIAVVGGKTFKFIK